MANVSKAGNTVINLVFFTFLAGILAAELATQFTAMNASSEYNWIDQNKSIIGLVFLVLFLVILKNSFGNKE